MSVEENVLVNLSKKDALFSLATLISTDCPLELLLLELLLLELLPNLPSSGLPFPSSFSFFNS